jgi:hypothetical protein
VSRPPHEEVLGDWLAAVARYAHWLEGQVASSPAMRPHAHTVRAGLAAVERVRRRRLPSPELERLLLEEVVWLATIVDAAREADRVDTVAALRRGLDVALQIGSDLGAALAELETTEEKRRAGLAAGRETQAEQSAERVPQLKALRPEFERLRKQLRSARGAARVLAARHGISFETIRKLFRGS